MQRFDLVASAAFSILWLVTLCAYAGWLPAGAFSLDLYRLFSFAGALGWLSGNVYMARRRRVHPALRFQLLLTYLTGPLALLFLLQALASDSLQREAPLAPVYSALIYWLFFLVPVTLRRVPLESLRSSDERGREGDSTGQ
ncbi:MAG: hypothetical protein AAGC60_09105 [Acidobacteriota bacterium]